MAVLTEVAGRYNAAKFEHERAVAQTKRDLQEGKSSGPERRMTNPSGISPTEYKVLVKPKEVEDKIGSIIIPDSKKDHDTYASVEGEIVALSHLAFTYADASEWDDKRPKPGDRVIYAKYAGVRVKGRDGIEYLLVNDKDICATIEE